jgi:hypothetical protein
MKSLAISFGPTGASLDFDRSVSEFSATIQAALVNIGTNRGSDDAYPQRGTTLLRDAVSGRLVSEQAAQHAVNFAAVDTLFFVRAHEPVDGGEKISEIVTEPIIQDVTSLKLRLQFRGDKGSIVGIINDLALDV